MNIVEIESSRPFMDRLFSGTLLSLVDRVEDDGFCETCFGELGGVKQYSTSHFPRDTAEAAWVLADCGRVDLGLRILSFTFNHIPHGQDYIPHVLARDGSVRSNAFQTDTLAHLARTLSRCAELTADQNIVHDMYRKLKPIADALWKGRFHPEWNLLDSGNFNEQGFCGTNEPLLDMFSNASCHAGFNAMGELAKRFGEDDVSEVNYLRAERLATGMEKTLYDPDQGVYSAAVTLDNQRMDLFNWLSIYTWRWYPGTSATYKRAFDKLWNETCNNWGRFSIPSCEPPHIRLRTLGKVVATLLSYSAENLETERLTTLLDFIEATVKKPDNLWPEFWYHHAPGPNDAEYYRNFLPRHAHVWTPYMENPDGDYTVDSGNCEQSSVFV
ncbi:MAG: hypothetical protein KAG97_10300, partial [Victivallales bacterium]|nr:hypothetical protein [Victivallales bacterium]